MDYDNYITGETSGEFLENIAEVAVDMFMDHDEWISKTWVHSVNQRKLTIGVEIDDGDSTWRHYPKFTLNKESMNDSSV